MASPASSPPPPPPPFIRSKIQRNLARDLDHASIWTLKAKLLASGVKGPALFEALRTHTLAIKEKHRFVNRCQHCYHDNARCICALLLGLTKTKLTHESLLINVKVCILMHHQEYMNCGNTGKLLAAMLPKSRAEVFVYGKQGEFERFENEINIDPSHTLTLWPGDGARTVAEFRESIDQSINSPWQTGPFAGVHPFTAVHPPETTPLLRVVLLDGVYNHARNMFSAMKKRIANNPPFVALHPTTISVFHRATKQYGKRSGRDVGRSENPKGEGRRRTLRTTRMNNTLRTTCCEQHAANNTLGRYICVWS